MRRSQPQSLKRKLLLQLLGPLLILIVLDGVGTIAIASHIATSIRDDSLLDSALALQGQLKVDGDRIALDFPPAAVEMFSAKRFDAVYAKVVSRVAGPLFKNARIPLPPSSVRGAGPVFYDAFIDDVDVRVVYLVKDNPKGIEDTVSILVAESCETRDATADLVLLMLAPLSIAMLVMGGLFIWLAVTRNLRKVEEISNRLTNYEPRHIVPIDEVEAVPLELQPIANAVNQLVRKVRAAQGLHERFIANSAHQLRTPLATLKIQIQRALRERDQEMKSQALSDAHHALVRLDHVAHQMLMLMRSEGQAGDSGIKPGPLDLAALAREVVEGFADVAVSRGIDLGYEGPERGVIVVGEHHLLRELMSNLLDNAIRYNTSGKSVTLSVHGEPPRLRVEDDGPGIPESERTRVLERFYRLRHNDSEGCGLGLSIASEIAARHGARLTIMTNPAGAGIVVEVVFRELDNAV